MSRTRAHRELRNLDWTIWQDDNGLFDNEQVARCLLMDIRAELQTLNNVFRCPRFLAVPALLEDIKRHTKKPAKKRGARKAR